MGAFFFFVQVMGGGDPLWLHRLPITVFFVLGYGHYGSHFVDIGAPL